MSDTPRTDDASFSVFVTSFGVKKQIETDLVEGSFARTLERELSLAQREIKVEQLSGKAMVAICEQRDAEIARLKQELKTAQTPICIGRPMIETLATQKDEVVDLALCETERLVLRQGQLYRFTALPDCARCQELAEAYHKTPTQRPS